MATIKTATALLTATGKKALKRVEIYMTNEAYAKFEKEAASQSRSTKNLLELTVSKAAEKFK